MPRLRFVVVTLFLLAAIWVIVSPRLRCVVEGVEVDTPSGPRAVEDLRVGDIVWSRDGRGVLSTSTVSAIRRSFTHRYLRFELGDAGKVELTASHPVAVHGEWVEAGRVGPPTSLKGVGGRSRRLASNR